MIVKKIKNNQISKPKAWQIGDLVDYIRHPHNRNPQEKIEFAGGRHFYSGTHAGQKLEMIDLAKETVRSKMPVQHWIFSWREGEQPTRAQVEEVVDIFLERMELAEHQTVYGLHYDTDNYHLHIAVNRVNPVTGAVVQPHKGFDLEEAHKILAVIEQKQGWASEENARYMVLENGELARRRKERKEVNPKQAALDFECATGEKSMQRIAQERGHCIIENAKSWAEFHEKLAEVGLRFEKKGSGAIIFVGEDAVKASSVDRKFSMKNLNKRLGDFVEGNYPKLAEPVPPEPVSSVNVDEWKEYQAENVKIEVPSSEHSELVRLRAHHKKERESALSRMAKYGFNMLNIARHCLKVQQGNEVRMLRQRQPKKRTGKMRFEAWLRAKGLHTQADRWRYRARIEQAKRPQQTPVEAIMQNNTSEGRSFEQYAAAVGADRYRVTCIQMDNDGEKKTFILDKKEGVSSGFTPNELIVRLTEMVRLQQRGENIYYTPLSEAKHHILIDDMDADSIGRLQKDGFSPAVILESSPGNFQCLLTIPKLRTGFDRDVGNRLTERLNQQYGDKKLSGCIHPHRAPGFENRKPKHRQANGSFPKVRLLVANRCECAKAHALSWEIDNEYAKATEAKKTRPRPITPSVRPGDPVVAYYAHFDNIRKHMSIDDYSRVDAMIALRMRSNGHGREDIAETIRHCAPTIRKKQQGRNWQRYAERTADYAFGVAGDEDLAKNERYQELWRRVEGIEEQKQQPSRFRMK